MEWSIKGGGGKNQQYGTGIVKPTGIGGAVGFSTDPNGGVP